MYNPLFQSNLSYSVVSSFRKTISLSLVGSQNRKRTLSFGINLKDKYCILSNHVWIIEKCICNSRNWKQVFLLIPHATENYFFRKSFSPSREVCGERKLWPKNWLLYGLSPSQEKKLLSQFSDIWKGKRVHAVPLTNRF